MKRRSFVSRILMMDGLILLLVAALYLVMTDSTARWIEERISPLEKPEIVPIFLINHVAVGILLIPLALTTFYCAWGAKKGQGWSRIVSLINGISVVSLPVVFYRLMGQQYYGSVLFVLASVLILIVGITMMLPVVWFPKDNLEKNENARTGVQNPPA